MSRNKPFILKNRLRVIISEAVLWYFYGGLSEKTNLSWTDVVTFSNIWLSLLNHSEKEKQNRDVCLWQQLFGSLPFLLLTLTVLEESWSVAPPLLVCGNLKSCTWPSVLSTYTSNTEKVRTREGTGGDTHRDSSNVRAWQQPLKDCMLAVGVIDCGFIGTWAKEKKSKK